MNQELKEFIKLQNQHFSNAFHMFSSRKSLMVSGEVQKILQFLKPDFLCMFDQFKHSQDLLAKLMQSICKLINVKIDQFYKIKCPVPLGQSIRWTIQSYHEEWKNLGTIKRIQNVWNESTMSIEECVCGQDLMTGQRQFCYKCGGLYHQFCFWGQERGKQNVYECPMCFMRNCFPDRQVQTILFSAYLFPTVDKTSFQFQLQFPLSAVIDPQIQIEMRCVRFNAESRYQITWPQFCDVFANNQLISSFKPLPPNSPLKKRVDNPLTISPQNLYSACQIRVCEYASQNMSPQWHMISICAVRKQSPDQILSKMVLNKISQKKSLKALSDLLHKESNQVEIDGITIINKCQYYGQKINVPAHSIMCTNHFQPFDIPNFIYSSIKAVSSSRKWKCPVCGVRAYDSGLDMLINSLLKQHGNIKQVFFNKQMECQLYYEEQAMECSSESSVIEEGKNIPILDLSDGQ